jgi:GntR family transcriptional regulator
MYVTGFRYTKKDKLPIALTEIYINPSYADVQRLIGTHKVPVHTLIERQFGVAISEVRQEIRATEVGAEAAKKLQMKQGSAGLLVTRFYLDAKDQAIEITSNLHPATRFVYGTTLRLKVA